ncbi:hypothetical protein DH2020_017663 [Rehmannia glutinosa]|uniref:Protein BZR1 homolog n=1 Tax=Rehmannia glutinosa TaxID=99300 RepID=A0ABR0WT77_REHGL
MKEAGRRERGGGNNMSTAVRSAVEKERTKMRERQRRSITTNIFHGLRKHGGYRLSPRADINEVLRHLALEAGWIVEPDGTTYRSTTVSNKKCADDAELQLLRRRRGECSTTTSPRRVTAGDDGVSAVNNLLLSGGMPANDALLAVYMCGTGTAAPRNACGSDATAAYGKGQQLYVLREAGVSKHYTPADR